MDGFLVKSKNSLADKFRKLSAGPLSDQEADAFCSLIIASLDGTLLHILIGGERAEYMYSWELQVKMLCDM